MRIASQLASLLALGVAALACSSCKDSTASGSTQVTPSAAPSAEPADVSLPGVDTSAMTPRERHEFSGLVTRLLAPCANTPVPVAQCVQEKRACAACQQAAKWIAATVREGASEEAIERGYRSRFDPAAVKAIPLEGSPTEGPDNAPVTIVEFADFECPHCRAAVPLFDALLKAHPGKIRLVYKFVELNMHVHAEAAARAAYAAAQQGKFWEMEHLLFERQDHLEQGDLERYAHILKLDEAKWKVDLTSKATDDRIAQDKKLADDLKLVGTPTIYVNGREVDIEADEPLDQLLEERVANELGVPPLPPASAAPPAAPPPTASAATTATPPGSASAKPH